MGLDWADTIPLAELPTWGEGWLTYTHLHPIRHLAHLGYRWVETRWLSQGDHPPVFPPIKDGGEGRYIAVDWC